MVSFLVTLYFIYNILFINLGVTFILMCLIVWQMKKQKQDKTLYLHKKRKMSAVPLDVAPERRTERCSPRSRPGDRFWSQVSDTCRQALRERNVGP